MYKIILVLVPVVLVLAAAYWFLSGNTINVTNSEPTATTTDTFSYSTSTPPSPAATTTPPSPAPITNQQKYMQATLHTSMGDITIDFDAAAPNTVANFIKLAQAGYYDGTKFHRVIKGFMDQAGDPLTKDNSKVAQWGTGGPGYTIADENLTAHNGVGVLAMANTGQPNSGGSQFFISAADNAFLDGKYSVFGKVTAGLDVVMAINNTPTDGSDRPVTPVVITGVTLK